MIFNKIDIMFVKYKEICYGSIKELCALTFSFENFSVGRRRLRFRGSLTFSLNETLKEREQVVETCILKSTISSKPRKTLLHIKVKGDKYSTRKLLIHIHRS